jgi:isocitrate/isopropylmalate dehydrogenase
VDVRIGVIQTTKEIDIELAAGTDRAEIRAAIDAALADDGARTGDLGGRGNTRLFAERVVAALG